MEDYRQNNSASKMVEENFVAGIVGAFLFSLAGVILWFIIYQLGYIAAVGGLVTVVCALKGYEIFGKTLSLKGLVSCLLISVFMIFVAEYICVGYEIYVAYKQEYVITIFDALRAVPDLLEEEAIRSSFVKDLVIGYALTLLGSIGNIISVISSRKRRESENVGL